MTKQEQIEKWLISCEEGTCDCPYNDNCVNGDCAVLLIKQAVDYINRLKAENANLTVENEVLKRDVQNLERTLEEGKEELERVRKETAKEILNKVLDIVVDEKVFEMAKEYGVEVEE